MFSKNLCDKVLKMKNWRWPFYLLPMLFVVVYFVFSVDAFFMEKIAKQNHLFSAFFKKAKTCLMEMALAPSFFKLWGF